MKFYEQVMGVYFDDLDAFRILHNARYFLLFERTLGSFWRELGAGEFAQSRDHTHLVRANTIEYLRPVRGTGEIRVRVWVERIGTTSLTFAFRMMPMDEDVEYAVGTRTVVSVDPDDYKPRPWSDGFREQLSPWVAKD